jgi:parallel beta-helix repeat protein
VVFTSGQAVPSSQDWQGIFVSSTATQVVIEHAEVRYANNGIEFAANATAHNNGACDTFCVRNSLIENNRYGLYLTGASPWIEANTIQSNTRDGIWLATGSPRIQDNTIQNNGGTYAGIRVGNASNPLITGAGLFATPKLAGRT